METKTGRKPAFAIFVDKMMVSSEPGTANVGAIQGQLCEIVHDD
ncbi:MAG TPA: hypothetical protein VFE47_25205 [Tepidisphaeraceae bacterium]|jgi:hypothetical protein|nr:hypothetical protein [Tepidisphaeraceae bacterium]